jgi:tetratricopeptide (TPR) repeat protein
MQTLFHDLPYQLRPPRIRRIMMAPALLLGTLLLMPAAVASSDDGEPQAVCMDGIVEQFVGPGNPAHYFRDTRRAVSLLEQQQWAKAEAILVQLTRDYPIHRGLFVNAANWGRLATALRHQGKHAEAIAAYEKAIANQGLSYPGGENARYWIAVSQLALDDVEAALDSLEHMVREKAYLRRAELFTDPNFAELRHHDRFRAIAGLARGHTALWLRHPDEVSRS